jgi:hypothetical protein
MVNKMLEQDKKQLMDELKIELANELKQSQHKQSNARITGAYLSILAVLLTVSTHFVRMINLSSDDSISMSGIAALLAGMFAFASIEAFRKTF